MLICQRVIYQTVTIIICLSFFSSLSSSYIILILLYMKKKTKLLLALALFLLAGAILIPVNATADDPNCWGTDGQLYFACYGVTSHCTIGYGPLQVNCKGTKMIVGELPKP